MNVDLSAPDQVVSKYFTDGKVSMDESLTDFQEPKKKFSGPKTTKPKAKPKPRAKKIKGQKDIRSALKKNEIVEYTKDFNAICKKSGIDVDSEQLQLAIAISKSLQEQNSEASTSASKPLTVKQRTGDIRKTLQEYGFRIPKIVTATGKRRLKKCKKDSKLLLTSDEEKQQIIADKYAQVLFQSLETASTEAKNAELYGFADTAPSFHIASNIAYKEIKKTTVFYIENLIEEYPNSIGSLLRDYSTIPGRLLSPLVKKKHDFDVVDLDLTDTDLDVLLSGKLEVAQKLVMDKLGNDKMMVKKRVAEKTMNDSVGELHPDDAFRNVMEENSQFGKRIKTTPKALLSDKNSTLKQFIDENSSTEDQYIDTEFEKRNENKAEPRCESPDLFDDDLSIDTSTVIVPDSQTVKESNLIHKEVDNMSQELNKTEIVDLTIKEKTKEVKPIVIDETLPITQRSIISDCTRRKSDDLMEITECVNNISKPESGNISMHTLNTRNVTRRKSDDLMEITDCVAQTKPSGIQDDIDLTQQSDDENNDTIILEHYKSSERVEMDLTQSTDSNDSLPFVHIGGTKSDNKKDCSILETAKSPEVKYIENIQENIENVRRQSKSSESSDVFEEFVYEHSHSSQENRTTADLNDDSFIKDKKIDLTQSSESNVTDLDKLDSPGIDYHHQEFENVDNGQDVTLIEGNDIDLGNKSYAEDDENIDVVNIDTEIPNDDYIDIINDAPMEYNMSRDDTILYDDFELNYDLNNQGGKLGNRNEETVNKSEEKQNNTSENHDNTPETNKNLSQSVSISQNSEVFEISDEELNYSVHKSKFCDNSQDLAQNFDLGGVSVLDNITSYRKSSTTNISKDFEDDSLPIVDIKGARVKTKSDHSFTPVKAKDFIETPKTTTNIKEVVANTPKIAVKTKEMVAETPKNSGFIVKFDHVTPMADYASMSTPERNTELDKFGLKPLKRKRAIQMLTHLYNQTHPLVEETEGSPSKKQKTKSPRKIIESTKENNSNEAIMGSSKVINETDKNDTVDEEMRSDNNDGVDKVIIKDVGDCDPEDWVFQKREKAKVHTCRVPLHIAFHNYISSSRELKEAILRYEPVNIEVIHKDLVAFGHRYDPKDLLKFLDKKCITVKTADNTARNENKRSKKKS